ncbi:MAG: YjdF family protein [Petrotogaceae bacterium]|jgi:hypothetical protein|nr:YjdF family protein [Petrotogaceae bacterium]
MEKGIRLTVFFEDPFWVGVFEKVEDQQLYVCKYVFGAEPKEYQIYELILTKLNNLYFSRGIYTEFKPEKKVNPKRMQRQVSSFLKSRGPCEKAFTAMKYEHELLKNERKKVKKVLDETKNTEKFLKKQLNKKEKHRGH